MKTRHNKKRNSGFVYEALLREATVAMMRRDKKRLDASVKLLKEHFSSNSILRKDLECYQSLYNNRHLSLNERASEKIIKEARLQKKLINEAELFKRQTALIHDINKNLGASVFDNFVPNYKSLATIAQIFSPKTSPRDQVILESHLVSEMSVSPSPAAEEVEIDNVIYSSFVNKFNDKYESTLLPEQKELLTYYISSFADNALELKMFLNQELCRLKSALTEAHKEEVFKADAEMINKSNKLVEKLNSYSTQTDLNESVLLTVLKTQTLVKEIYHDGSSN